ncbi:MAG: helix-turn-helix domain-containing protein [Peptostreptococcaceae bacterium]|nr:helix-turn-helix domain-containing protein [Peptostreptococcaceae bacterium]
MNKKYEIGKEHLEEIRQARKQTKDKREDRRLWAVELRILGYTNEEIVEKVQVHEKTVIRWIQNYAEHGIEGLRNKPIVGNHRNLTFEEEAKLLKSFEERARKG